MSSNALLWPSQGTKPEERLDKYKYQRLPSQGIGNAVISLNLRVTPIGDQRVTPEGDRRIYL